MHPGNVATEVSKYELGIAAASTGTGLGPKWYLRAQQDGLVSLRVWPAGQDRGSGLMFGELGFCFFVWVIGLRVLLVRTPDHGGLIAPGEHQH